VGVCMQGRIALRALLSGVVGLLVIASAPHVKADEDADAGKQIFEMYCAACHGFDGVPLLPEMPNFAKGERMEKSDADLLKTIQEGKAGTVMPSWTGVLTVEQREEALAFIREISADEGS